MPFDTTKSHHLIGTSPVDIAQLDKLSNIASPGEWLYRVDSIDPISPCLKSGLQPPLCDRKIQTAIITTTPESVEPEIFSSLSPYTHPFINFEDNGETVTFPSFVTLLPQLVTLKKEVPKNLIEFAQTAHPDVEETKMPASSTTLTISTPLKIDPIEPTTIKIATESYPSSTVSYTNETVNATTMSNLIDDISASTEDLPTLHLFTQPASTTRKSTRSPVPIKLATQKPKEKQHKTTFKKKYGQEVNIGNDYQQSGKNSGTLTDDGDLGSTGSTTF